ncbi:MAG: TrmH family RNA methyltransferase [Candidatus Dormibacteraceae bacterium]
MPRTASDQPLSSPDNPAVRRLRRLLRRREEGLVFLEGPRVVAAAVAARVPLELLALREGSAFEAPAEQTVTLAPGLFRELSRTVTPQGVLAIGRAGTASLDAALAGARAARRPLVVLDAVQDPGNVGAVLRTAAAAGAPAAAILPGTADPLGAKAVRASAGAVFRLLLARAEWGELEGLDGWGAAAHGGTPMARAKFEEGGMLVLGSEVRGLSRPDLATVTIPTVAVESLNVAAAAAILLFEIGRRRPS